MLSPTGPPARRSGLRNQAASNTLAKKAAATANKRLVQAAMVFCLGSFSLLPILILENLHAKDPSTSSNGAPASVDRLVNIAKHLQKGHLQPVAQVNKDKDDKSGSVSAVKSDADDRQEKKVEKPIVAAVEKHNVAIRSVRAVKKAAPLETKKDPAAIPKIRNRNIPKHVSELRSLQDTDFVNKPVARGVAGRSNAPALDGAKRAHIECDVNVDSLAYWNDPQGKRDQDFVTLFMVTNNNSSESRKYITFTPDQGGWNNIRMSMEIIFVVAAATGRTLVLPPKAPLYLLHHNEANKHKGFADFYPLMNPAFQKRVKVISMQEFLEKEGGSAGIVPIPEINKTVILKSADHCEAMRRSEISCAPLWDFLSTVANVPNISDAMCLVFDQDTYNGKVPDSSVQASVLENCGKRKIVYWSGDVFKNANVLHFEAGGKHTRLLAHFYAMIHFTNPSIDHFFKRFVRDFLHYHDSIFCAAGKVVKAVQAEGLARGFKPDENGAGGFSSLHVRRGDLQYKSVKISAQEWYDNTKDVWKPNELLYVATDERKKEFFNDFAAHHDLRYLDDYWDLAGLGDLDGSYMGMIDTIVASRGRTFAGTFFSTFTGFINRMR
jgi:hypothetical protein